MSVLTRIHTLLATRNDQGATAVEYGLLLALIAGVIIVVVAALGQDVLSGLDTMEDRFNGSQA